LIDSGLAAAGKEAGGGRLVRRRRRFLSRFHYIVTHSDSWKAVSMNTQTLRVTTFNLRVDTSVDGENRWDMRKEFALQVIRQLDPDVLATQEPRRHQAEFLKERLTDYIHIGLGRDGMAGEQNAVYLRKERLEILDSGFFALSETPEVMGSMGWDAAYSRLATWIRARDRRTDRPVMIMNTHLDNKGETARLEGAKMVKRWLAEQAAGGGVILCGDMNCSDGSPPVEELLKAAEGLALADAYRAVHPVVGKEEATLNKFVGIVEGLRIDFILHTPHLRAVAAEITRTSRDGRYPSDHYPLSATLEWVENK
jgi:endonuclease/exonuclease/phosphatase family metal-dependent hydrolase